MRMVEEQTFVESLAPLAARTPRVVIAGNFATPWALLDVVDRTLPRYRLFALNAQRGFPDRDGVVHETPFVGPGVRASPRLEYLPARLSLVPGCSRAPTCLTWSSCIRPRRARGVSRSAWRSTCCPPPSSRPVRGAAWSLRR